MLDPHALLRLLACELLGSTLSPLINPSRKFKEIKFVRAIGQSKGPTSNRHKLPKPYQIKHLTHCSGFQIVDN